MAVGHGACVYASVIVPPPALLMCTKSELQLSAVGGRVHSIAMKKAELPILAFAGRELLVT